MQKNELESFRSLVSGQGYSEESYKESTDEDGDTHFEWETEVKVIGVSFYDEEEGEPIVLFAAKKGVCGATQQGFHFAHEVFAQLQKELE
jgi:hypothetical protein